jgi:hypothetical protein
VARAGTTSKNVRMLTVADAAAVEIELQRQWHEDVCGCQDWPAKCVSYGAGWRSRAPWTFDVETVIETHERMNAHPEEEQ